MRAPWISSAPVLVLALALAAGAAAPARADRAVPEPSGEPLALEQALDLARERNHDLRAARARLDQSAAAIEAAWSQLLPLLAAQAKYTHNYKEVTIQIPTGPTTFETVVVQKQEQVDAQLQVTVPLLAPYAYANLRAARQSYAGAAASTDASDATLLLSVAQAFYAAAGADELVVARRHAIEVARQTLQNARARYEAGTVQKVELTRAELALVRAEQAATESEDTRAQAYRALATLIQKREPFQVVPAEEPAPPKSALAELVEGAFRRRPETRAYQRNVDAAKSRADAAGWRWAPTVSGFGLLRAFNYAGFSGDQYSWAVGAQLDWQLYDAGARDAQRHQAQAETRENLERLALLGDTMRDDIANARQAVETKRLALATARHALELSRETLNLVRVQHGAGTATQLDLLTAQDSLVAAEVGVAQARFDLGLSDLALRRAAGLFPDKPLR